MKRFIVALSALTGLVTSNSFGVITVASETDAGGWNTVAGNYDFLSDQQTGQPSSDIVGGTGGSYNTYDAGFFTNWDAQTGSSTDGVMGFRVRLDRYDTNSTPSTYEGQLWVGMDADLDGDVDVFMGVSNSGSNDHVGIYDAGTGLNNSPSTTTISNTAGTIYTLSSTNYNYRQVTAADGGTTTDITAGGTDTDYYVSFTVNFADVVAFLNSANGGNISITDTTSVRYVLGTATQDNSLNQDIGLLPKNFDKNATWTALGGFSPIMNASGTAVPEPSAALLGGLGMLALFRRRRN